MKCRDCRLEAEPDRSRCTKHLEHYRNYARINMENIKSKTLVRKYGIDIDQYHEMSDAQGGLCAICLEPETVSTGRYGGTNRLAVDHDHITGRVRGLLCRNCNTTLGNMNDDPERLRRAADYLEVRE